MEYKINCPYCFNQFNQKEVLFKKSQSKNESQFDNQTLINPQKESCKLICDDGFIVSVKDSSGNLFNDRVCPYCHNSLPHMYGKYPVKRIVLTGAVGCGKTVYLSSLLRNIQTYCTSLNISCIPQSKSVNKYLQNNTIEAGKPLPHATLTDGHIDPLSVDMRLANEDGGITTVTIVFYDFAGEEILSQRNRVQEAIKHADGIIFLQDPIHFQRIINNESPNMYDSGLQTISHLLAKNDYCRIPFAACISKCDILIDDRIYSGELVDLLKENDKSAENFKGFCAIDYNKLSKAIDDFHRKIDFWTRTTLKTSFDCFNYFAVSALNCKTVLSDENVLVPTEEPHPMRIEEPLYWLLYQFGLINCDGTIIDHAVVGKIAKINKQKEMWKKELSEAQSRRFGRRRRVQECADNLNRIEKEIQVLMNS